MGHNNNHENCRSSTPLLDPPVLSPESEEELVQNGYPRQNVPSLGKEPLRVGDIICYRTYPMSTISYAQVLDISSFEDSRENKRPVLRLNDPYPVQYDNSIRRVYTINYLTGELEGNRK